MNRKILWVLLAVAVVAAILLIALHPWANGTDNDPKQAEDGQAEDASPDASATQAEEAADGEPELEEGELPPMEGDSALPAASSAPSGEEASATPAVTADPEPEEGSESGPEPDEDELPVLTP